MLELIPLLGGGLMRLMPEVFKLFTASSERKHEREMLTLNLEADKQRSISAHIEAQGVIDASYIKSQADIAQAQFKALSVAAKAQAEKTGIKFVDGLNALMRPIITLQWVVFLWPMIICVTFFYALHIDTPVLDALNMAFGEQEKGVCLGIVGFWFMSRVIDKPR